jgi:histidinol-phosphate aminotransferase
MNNFSKIAKPWIGDLGVYEPGKPIEEVARELGFDSAADIVKIASNENSLGPSPAAIAAMQEGAAAMHRYPDGGAYYLRRKLAERLHVSLEQLVVGNGSNELLELMGHVFLDAGNNVVVADRAFIVYKLIAAVCRAETIAVPMRELTHDLDAMLQAITPQTRLVFISNPNNPTGTMVDGAALDRFMDAVPDHVVVVLDEAYIELLPAEKQPDTLKYVADDRNVIVTRTFSKTYGLAGLRIGYAVAPTDCIRLLHRVRQPFNANAMAQTAALAALDDDEHVARTREMVAAGLSYLETALTAMSVPFVGSVVNFMLVEVGNGRAVFEALQKEKVIVRPMDVYGLPDYVRVTVGTPEENERCVQALKKVLQK